MLSAGFKAKGARGQPRLSEDPDPAKVERALAVLSLFSEVRNAADRLGFGSLWAKVAEAVESRLQTYSEDLIDKLRDEQEAALHDRIRLYLEAAAQCMTLTAGEKSGQIIRRRLASAADAARPAA